MKIVLHFDQFKHFAGASYQEFFYHIIPILTYTNHSERPTGSVMVERSPPERKVVSSSHSRVIPKT